MNAFDHMSISLGIKNTNKRIHINRQDYEIFCKEFIFDKLRGDRFGKAFCKKFEIEDFLLANIKDEEDTKYLIEKLGYIHDDTYSN